MQVKQELEFSNSCCLDVKPVLKHNPWSGNINDTYSPINQASIMGVNEPPSVNGNTNNNSIPNHTQLKTFIGMSNHNLQNGISSISTSQANCMLTTIQNTIPNVVPTYVFANQSNIQESKSTVSRSTQNKNVNSVMYHALPKRIAQMQQQCLYQSRKQRLAEPKHIHKDKQLVFHHYTNTSRDDNIMQRGSMQGVSDCHREGVHTDILDKGPAVDKQTTLEQCENDNMEGLFGWTKIDNVYIPYIFRSDNEKYVCVRLLEQKILKKYPNVFPKELAVREPLTSSFITMNECKVFNQLVRLQNKGQVSTKFDQDDVVVSLSDFIEFYNAVKKVFSDWREEMDDSPKKEQLKIAVLSGWMQVNNTIVPYIRRRDTKLLPLAVLKHAASIDICSEGLIPSDDECKELNRRCSDEGFKFVFKSSSKLVPLHDIEYIPNVQVFELPEKDPLTSAQYLQTEDQNQNGMKLNIHQTHHRQYGNQPAYLTTKRLNNTENQIVEQRQPSFVYSRFPSSVQNGSPNVTLVPEDRPRYPPIAQRVQTDGHSIPSIHGNFRHFNIERTCEFPHEGAPFGQKAFLSSLPLGQNINVNYGINIQNISSTSRVDQARELHATERRNKEISVAIEHNVSTNGNHVAPHKGCFNQGPSCDKSNALEKSDTTCMATIQLPTATVIKHPSSNEFDKTGSACTNTVNMQPMVESTLVMSEVDSLNNNNSAQNQQPTYQMKQRQAINELLSCIKGVWLCGKNISCMHLIKPGRSGKFCLVEAICKLYYGNTTVSHFLFTIENVLATFTCTELEEQAFIQYYQLPVNVLKCNKMIELSAFENLYPQLTEVLKGVSPEVANSKGKRGLLPLPDMNRMSLCRKRYRQQFSPYRRGTQSLDKGKNSFLNFSIETMNLTSYICMIVLVVSLFGKCDIDRG